MTKVTPEELKHLPIDTAMGTGFVVMVHDDRLSPNPDPKLDVGFGYLVTNRHVVQPGIESGKPSVVTNYSVTLNHKGDATNSSTHAELIALGKNVEWHYSTDDSVDLAVTPFKPSTELYDFISIPEKAFVTQELIDSKAGGRG